MALAAAPTAINPSTCCRFFFSSPRKPLSLVTTSIKKSPSSPPHPLRLLSGHRPLRLSPLKASSSSFNGFAHPQNSGTKTKNFDAESSEAGFRGRVLSGLVFLRSLLSGGSWWNLEVEEEEGRGGEEGKRDRKKGVSVIVALRRMWMLVASDRWVIFLAFTCLMIAALSEISIPHFLAASIFSAQSGKSMIFYRNARLLVLLCFASGICSGLRSCSFGIANMILVRRMREKLYDALLLQDISFFDEETVGDLTSRLGADCQQVSRVFGNDLNLIARNVVQGTGALIYLFILSWPLASSTLLICSALATIMLIHGQYQKKAAKLIQELTACANEVAQETFSLVRTVRVYGMEKHEFGRFSLSLSPPPPPKPWLPSLSSFHPLSSPSLSLPEHMCGCMYTPRDISLSLCCDSITVLMVCTNICDRYIKWLGLLSNVNLRQSMAFGFWSSSFNFLYHSTQVIAVLIGGISIISGHITAEQLTKFILYSEWLIYSTWWVGDNWSSLMQSIGASEKVFQLMDLLPSNQFLSQGRRLRKLEGHVDFINISFRYPSRLMVPVLQQVNLSVHPNEVVAIAGLSGSGKSTLVNLLLRLYEPTDGQILVDGVPLVDLDIKWLRERIGFVGQEPRLFRMDVSSNIKYGCPREVTDEQVEWAAKQANAHEFILSLPDGYATLVDDSLLSGGQKQRIAIARAILRDPTILILDEATSALDAESEHYVKRVLRLVQNRSNLRRTVIIIAHRLSTIQAADRIIVMESGRIVEMGSHMELLQKDGLYARLAKRQADAFA